MPWNFVEVCVWEPFKSSYHQYNHCNNLMQEQICDECAINCTFVYFSIETFSKKNNTECSRYS